MWRRRAVQTLLGLSWKSQNHGHSPSSSSSSSRFYSGSCGKKGKLAPLQERRMVDRLRIWAKGGEGGNGCWSTRRSRTDRHGKADGGNGGRGGDVVLESSASVWDFSNLQHHLNAKRGGNGTSKNRIGTRGADKLVQVPVGTVIHLVDGEAPFFVENRCSHSLQPWEIPDAAESEASPPDQQNDCEIGCRDGASSSSSDRKWRSLSESSEPSSSSSSSSSEDDGYEIEDSGEEEQREEILHSVAELTQPGLRIVIACGGEGGLGNSSHRRRGSGGMPNAGKSTLLGAISPAKPIVGDYAFTTLRPNIGNLSYEDFFSVTVADIPGIIKGAHENRGLGHAFLRHIERTKVLAYVVDLAAALGLRDLVVELERHQEGLSARPSLVVANKVDEDGAEAVFEELRRRVLGVPIFAVSAVLEEGVPELKAGLRRLIDGGDSAAAGGIRLEKIVVD
ncbi:unnamed protein product [Spirodela intermedia]|uniref:Uncharacterized protein n=1 Tax=Spirodela intermedia TaxID=51605 RepID=A0A7I8IDP7_SPIIN|nr:unnamed protein product [Spirodela intermedia]CAA6654971.1 unnamed protein product [Spirodela intermedia]